MKKTLSVALKATLPVFFGYLVLGIAFGLLLSQAGYNALWAFFISVFVYAGSMQFVLVELLRSAASLLTTAITTLSVNSRHIFYGLSFLDKFKNMGKRKFYMIFSLTDETYSLLSSVKAPKDVSEKDLFFVIALLNHLYWIFGSVVGNIAGNIIPFSTEGVEFSMTALFVVILVEQLLAKPNILPVIFGFASSILCLLLFGANHFIVPAMLLVIVLLFAFKTQITPVTDCEGKNDHE